MSMSRRHFNKLAALVATYDNNGGGVGTVKLAEDLADLCASENANFDRERFLSAALPVAREAAS